MECNLCNQPMKPWLKMPLDPKKKTLSTHDTFYFCESCSFGSMSPLPAVEDISGFYDLKSYYTQNGSHMPNLSPSLFDKMLTKLAHWFDEGDVRRPGYFQSRFGKATWLQPYTEPVLIELAEQGMKRIDVVCPGFSVDCLETIDEIAFEYHFTFAAVSNNKYTIRTTVSEWEFPFCHISAQNPI